MNMFIFTYSHRAKGPASDRLKVWSVETGELLFEIKVQSLYFVALSPDATKFIIKGGYIAKLWEAKNAQKLANYPNHSC
jgi:hypothetical protein